MQSFIKTVYNITDKSLFMYIAKLLQILCLLNKAIIHNNASNKEARYKPTKDAQWVVFYARKKNDLSAYMVRNQITGVFSSWPEPLLEN